MTEKERKSVLDQNREKVKRRVFKKHLFKNAFSNILPKSLTTFHNLLRRGQKRLRKSISNANTKD